MPEIDGARARAGIPLKADARYPQPLPPELAPFYCYPLDAGHCILAVPEEFAGQAPVEDYLVPTPVRTVLRRYRLLEGVPVVEVPYDPDLGLLTDPADEEW